MMIEGDKKKQPLPEGKTVRPRILSLAMLEVLYQGIQQLSTFVSMLYDFVTI